MTGGIITTNSLLGLYFSSCVIRDRQVSKVVAMAATLRIDDCVVTNFPLSQFSIQLPLLRRLISLIVVIGRPFLRCFDSITVSVRDENIEHLATTIHSTVAVGKD